MENSKNSYLAARKEWAIKYMDLSKLIRQQRNQRASSARNYHLDMINMPRLAKGVLIRESYYQLLKIEYALAMSRFRADQMMYALKILKEEAAKKYHQIKIVS